MRPLWFSLFGLVALSFVPSLRAENWPQWRGPRMDGTSLDQGFPTAITDKSIVWKIELPGDGHASPIVWNDRVFVVASEAEHEERLLMCLDRVGGKVLWKTEVLKAPLEGKHKLNSHASSTPATDGERVFTTFLDTDEVVVSAHNFSGKKVWQVRVGKFFSKHGLSSSPVVYKDKIIVNCDHDGDGYIVALSRTDGKELWRIDRPNKTRSYCVPLIRDMAGKTQMVLSGSKCVTSYDPDTGKLIWIIDGPTEQFVASLVYHEKTGLLYMTGGFPEHHILAIKPDGLGNVTETHIEWRTNKGVGYVPSPICEGPYFLSMSDSGVAHCFDAKTGEIFWEERMREHHASLASAEGKVYYINDFGTLRVVKPGKTYDLVAESEVDEKVFASPAFSEGQIFIRGGQHLFCVGKRIAPTAAR
jgi:outer membrane protein assembly factor BamB